MGLDFFSNQTNNEEHYEIRPIFFRNINRERVSRKKNFSSDKIIEKNKTKILFKKDLSDQIINFFYSKDIANFLNARENTKPKEENISNNSSLLSSTTEDPKTYIDIYQSNEILFFPKRGEDLRKSYYQKLYINKIQLNIISNKS